MGSFLPHQPTDPSPGSGWPVYVSCPGGGSRLGILPVPARQSSVAPGMRLRGQLFRGCFEEGWGGRLTPSLG